jgi:hypothetical protein
MGWTVRGSNPGEGEIFRTRPDWHQGPSCFLHNGYRVLFARIKRPWCGADHPALYSAEVKEEVVILPFPLLAFMASARLSPPLNHARLGANHLELGSFSSLEVHTIKALVFTNITTATTTPITTYYQPPQTAASVV